MVGGRTDLFDRADTDAVCFAQSAVDGASLGDAHLGAMDEEGDIGRIGVAIANKAYDSWDL